MIREPQRQAVERASGGLGTWDVGPISGVQGSPQVSDGDLQVDWDAINEMISEGGPTCSTGSGAIYGTLDEAEQLTGMIHELQNNQATLNGLLSWYGTFVFTGGDVPSGQCDLAAVNSYLERPFAADRIFTGEIERYQHLVREIMELGQGLAPGPRTLRCRKSIGDAFKRASSQIQSLGSALKSALTSLAQSSLGSQSVLGITNA